MDAATALRTAVMFYASFDEAVRGDLGGGGLVPSTRFNHETEAGKFVFESGFDSAKFRIAPGKGIHGGALEATDVLPRNGRIFFPLAGNLAFQKRGWGGAVSVWCKTDPNRLITAKFCDPVQITQRGANNGGIWFDFNDKPRPRDMRHGAFPAVSVGAKPIAETDADAPLVAVSPIEWRADDWHHVVLSWRNFDTGRDDAMSSFYVDGRLIGEIKGRAIAMDWDVEKAGIYVAVNYIGLLDELALFRREVTAEEVGLLYREPGICAGLKQ